jgi:hypothetical protein
VIYITLRLLYLTGQYLFACKTGAFVTGPAAQPYDIATGVPITAAYESLRRPRHHHLTGGAFD